MASGIVGRTLVLTTLGAALIGAAPAAAGETGSTGKVVQFRVQDSRQLDELNESGLYDVIEVHDGWAKAIQLTDVPPRMASEEVAMLEASLSDLHVVMEDADAELAEFRAKGSEGLYHSYDETLAELASLTAAHPDLLTMESLGKSHEGRDMMAVRLTSAAGVAADKPHVFLYGLTHAREWISAELPMYLLNHLVSGYGTDADATRMVDGLVIWILPIVNPDGLQYSQTEYKMWRKNRSPQGGNRFGVDINRNFPVGWGQGSSSWAGSDTYRGTEPKSELETRAMMRHFERERFVAALSFHSYSELILFPWGYQRDASADDAAFKSRTGAMSDKNGYTAGQVSKILYIAGGATDDTWYKDFGAWAYTFELGRQFVPPESQIKTICEQNLPAVMVFLEQALEGQRPSTGTPSQLLPKVANFFGLYELRELR